MFICVCVRLREGGRERIRKKKCVCVFSGLLNVSQLLRQRSSQCRYFVGNSSVCFLSAGFETGLFSVVPFKAFFSLSHKHTHSHLCLGLRHTNMHTHISVWD